MTSSQIITALMAGLLLATTAPANAAPSGLRNGVDGVGAGQPGAGLPGAGLPGAGHPGGTRVRPGLPRPLHPSSDVAKR